MFDWLQLISCIWSDKRDLLIEATTQIRTLLCGGERHPINLFTNRFDTSVAKT